MAQVGFKPAPRRSRSPSITALLTARLRCRRLQTVGKILSDLQIEPKLLSLR